MKSIEEIIETPIQMDNSLILKLIQLIDLTSLDSTDSKKTIDKLIKKGNADFHGVRVAALCTYAGFGTYLKTNAHPKLKIAVVGGCFPSGQTLSKAKIEECKLIAETPVDEIDIVLNRGDFFDQNYEAIVNEIREIKNVIGEKHLKVILETGDYSTQEEIKKVSLLAIEGGADFIKTSTGKSGIGASPEAVYTMCQIIKSHYDQTNKRIGIKPSGGIRTPEQALTYYQIVQEILGEDWLNADLFRIGASSLYDQLTNAHH